MSENISVKALHREASAWVRAQSKPIHAALIKQYAHTLKPTGTIQWSSLSELGLCNALYSINLPGGYIIPLSGSVEVYNPYNPEELITNTSHTFGQKGNFVICITPGQFFDFQYPGQGVGAGDRVQIYKQIAPKLITTFNTGVAVLHGTVEEIQEQLGLKFKA